MHMSDALLSPAVGVAMWAVTGATAAYASRRLRRTNDDRLVPLMGVLGAFVFAVQMINFAIPGTGSSGHLAGGMLLAILLGPHAAFLTLASVLIVQALFFADGGLMALGANIFNMAVVPCYVVWPLLNRQRAQEGPGGWWRRGVTLIAVVTAVLLGAMGVVVETTASGIAELPFAAFALVMLPVHLAIGLVEGLITLAVVGFLQRMDPSVARLVREEGTERRRGLLPGIAAAALVAGGCLSWFAATDPDGLEWSLARIAGKSELATPATAAHRTAKALQERIAVMPDYAPPRTDAAPVEPAPQSWGAPNAATTVAGVLGGGVTLLLVSLIGWGLRRRGGGAVTPG